MARKLKVTGPVWETVVPATEDEPALEVLVGPVTRSVKERAWAALDRAFQGEAAPAEASDAFALAVLGARISDWRGFGDGEGVEISYTAENLATWCQDPDVGPILLMRYADPVTAEMLRKNVSSGGPDGGSPGSETKTAPTPEAPSAAPGSAARATGPAATRGEPAPTS